MLGEGAMLPAACQGAIGITCREDDTVTLRCVISHLPTHLDACMVCYPNGHGRECCCCAVCRLLAEGAGLLGPLGDTAVSSVPAQAQETSLLALRRRGRFPGTLAAISHSPTVFDKFAGGGALPTACVPTPAAACIFKSSSTSLVPTRLVPMSKSSTY